MGPTATKVDWFLQGTEIAVCNCDWNCPCEFNMRMPTHGFCEAFGVLAIEQGRFGDTDMSGAKWCVAYHWPGPVHEGEGHRMVILDPSLSEAQRDAVVSLDSGEHGHPYFEIFASVTPHVAEPIVAAVRVEYDFDRRVAMIGADGVGSAEIEPIPSVVGPPKRLRLDMPEGFEFKLAEVANASSWSVDGPGPLAMRHNQTYAILSRLNWASDGSTR